uniref:Uncharacterized protein n=1 Tax=Leersia perrieri TaxID=77586 RepID=A0A0D9V031_9ORYZ
MGGHHITYGMRKEIEEEECPAACVRIKASYASASRQSSFLRHSQNVSIASASFECSRLQRLPDSLDLSQVAAAGIVGEKTMPRESVMLASLQDQNYT